MKLPLYSFPMVAACVALAWVVARMELHPRQHVRAKRKPHKDWSARKNRQTQRRCS